MDGGSDPRPRSLPGAVEHGSEGLHESLLRQNPSVLVASEGPDALVAYVNDAGAALLTGAGGLGVPLREAIGLEQGLDMVELVDRVYRTGEAEIGYEWEVVLRGGGERRRLSLTMTPWRTPEGVTRGVILQGHDITRIVRARESAEAEATESTERYGVAREVVATLQHALLPADLPVLPQVHLAAHYLVAGVEQAAGGDWFEAIPLPDGRLALVVGDVVGHGVAASAAMALLRAVVAELLTSSGDLEETVRRVDAFAARTPAAYGATLAIAILGPVTGALHYCTLGHPPPLVVGPDGARFLVAGDAGPLGTLAADAAGRVTVHTDRVGIGETVLLYTDGLVERPGEPLREGLDTLAQLSARLAAPRVPGEDDATGTARLSRQVVRLMLRNGYSDDVTLLSARRAKVPQPLRLDLSGDVAELSGLRDRVGEWLLGLGACLEDQLDLQLALTEAVSNSLEHAYAGDGAGPVRVEAILQRDGRVRCAVIDQGRWREPDPVSAYRGRGLGIIAHFTDAMTIEHRDDGTTVQMLRRVRHCAELGTTHAVPQRATAQVPFGVDLLPFSEPVLRVSGPVDAGTASDLASQLRQASRGGILPLTVDLSDVTQLASAGVRVLHELAAELRAGSASLTLVASPGSLARQVLELVRLPHTTVLDPSAIDQRPR